MNDFQKARASHMLQSFSTEEETFQKSDIAHLDYLEKGGTRAVIGERRMFGGREYIKTATGWKFHGKGTGAQAQAHRASAGEHHTEVAVNANKPIPPTESIPKPARATRAPRVPAQSRISEVQRDNVPDFLPKGTWEAEVDFRVSPGGGWAVTFKKGAKIRTDGRGKVESYNESEGKWVLRRPPIQNTNTFRFNAYGASATLYNAFARNLIPDDHADLPV